MRTPTTVLAILLTIAAAAPSLHAQSPHVASQAALDAAIQQHVDHTAAQRAAVLRVRSTVPRGIRGISHKRESCSASNSDWLYPRDLKRSAWSGTAQRLALRSTLC